MAARPLIPSRIHDEVLDIRPQAFAILLVASLIISAMITSVLTIVLGRRYGLGTRRIVARSLAELLVGPAGLVVLLGLYQCFAHEVCFACGAHRSVDHRFCPHWPESSLPPLTDGTEIFEPQEDFIEATA